MKITFVNHSGFIIEYGGKRIMCDPWMEGAVFNNGWKLYAPTLFSYDDFKGIDYIWFSHEHPDHFYPPNLNKIDPEHRKDITILFQNTIDKRVKSYCTKSGFKDVVELQKNTYFEVTHSFELMCEHFQEGDSWIHFKTPEMSILNTNDCGITSIADAKKIINKVGHVDVLMTQFSYAYWAGNPEDLRHRQKVANDKLAGLQFQCEQFRPSVVMPIASYIYFCHEENQYLNDSINTPSKTYEYIKKNVESHPVFLYNSESYYFPKSHDSISSIAKYEKKLALALEDKTAYLTNNEVPIGELKKSAEQFLNNINSTNSWFVRLLLKPVILQLFETKDIYVLTRRSFKKVPNEAQPIDVILSSETLQACFKLPYGLDSVQISGRLRKPKGGNYKNFYNLFRINHLKMRGINPNSVQYLLGMLYRKTFG